MKVEVWGNILWRGEKFGCVRERGEVGIGRLEDRGVGDVVGRPLVLGKEKFRRWGEDFGIFGLLVGW